MGGGLALAFAAAPALFRAIPSRAVAGNAFGEVLARWDRVALLAVALVAVTAILRAVNYETADARHWVRWALLVVMGAATVYASGWAGPVARQLRAQLPAFDDLPEGHAARREFAKLHAAARRGMTLAVFAGLAALLVS